MINAMRLGVGLWVETRRFGLGTMGRAALLRLGQDFRDFFFFYNGFYIFFQLLKRGLRNGCSSSDVFVLFLLPHCCRCL